MIKPALQRKQLLFLGLFILFSFHAVAALTIIENTGNTTNVANYLSDIPVFNQKTQERLIDMLYQQKIDLQHQQVNTNNMLFPVESRFSVGDVPKHKLADNISQRISGAPFFVIGDDQRSIHWLKTNAVYLKKIGAIGLLTNVQNQSRKEALERKTSFSLVTASLDGLKELVGTEHYPFLAYKGWVLQ